MNTYEISLIVPVHNSSNFVETIFKNISTQTFTNFEVIIVDDHSQDNTTKAIKEKFKNKNFEYQILLSNGNGVSAARNTGIENSQGKYIAFIDDDDELSEDYLQVLYNTAKKDKAEVVLGSYIEVFNHKKVPKIFKENITYNNLEIRKKIIPQTIFPINNEEEVWLPVWRSLILKDVISYNNIKFDEKISQAEDFIFMLEILFKTKKISLISEKPIYFYNRRSTSSMNRYIIDDLSNQIYFHKVFVNILQENKLFEDIKYRYLSNRLRMYSTVMSNAVRAPKKRQILDEMRETQNTLKNDIYLKKVSFKNLYNPITVKFLMILLKHNHINVLYTIYSYKEQKRLRKFG